MTKSNGVTLGAAISAFIATSAMMLPVVTNPAQASTTGITLSVFSTFPSEQLEMVCRESNIDLQPACTEDALPPDAFIGALQANVPFNAILPFEDNADYSLLIANLGQTFNNSPEQMQLAEFTLQWRGIEIDSFTIVQEHTQNTSAQDVAVKLVDAWHKNVITNKIFTSPFLYHALNASDYENNLVVPERVGNFTRLDTQLYPDPFRGSITRYIHPTFEEALVDVTVYPILARLDSDTDALLNAALNEDWNRAGDVATAKNLQLSQAAPASPYIVSETLKGWRLGLKAESELEPTIFATTYVFQLSDKYIKVATTFPADFSDPIIDELLAQIAVPDESPLMIEIRKMLLN